MDRAELSRGRAEGGTEGTRRRAGAGTAMRSPGSDRRRARRHGEPFRPRSPAERRPESLWIYGIHPVLAALANPRRKVTRIVATANALQRLTDAGGELPIKPEEASPRD